MSEPFSKTPLASPEKHAFTEVEAAIYVGMSRSFLQKPRSRGNLVGHTPAPPHLKTPGGRILYLLEDLDAWLEAWKPKGVSGEDDPED